MYLHQVTIRNFRTFVSFDHDFGGESTLLISENGVGKTSLLEAIARALGIDTREFRQEDFADLSQPIEIKAVLTDLSATLQAALTNHLSYTGGLNVTVGATASWDPSAEQVSSTHGFPKPTGWARSSRAERDALPVVWLPAWRDPGRLLEVGAPASLLGQLIAGLPISGTLQAAVQAISGAGRSLSQDAAVTDLLESAAARLSALLPGLPAQVFDLDFAGSSDRALLRQLGLLMAYNTSAVSVVRQSGGLRQLAVHAFALEMISLTPDAVVLFDEPEVALHPHVQRALTSTLIEDSGHQSILATHSASVLARADARRVVRLRLDDSTGTEAVRAQGLTGDEAEALKRFTTADTAEALFARRVVFVEGDGDRIALTSLAEQLGRDLDAEGVGIVTLSGSGLLKHYLKLLGPQGLQTEIAGLCDEDAEAAWAVALSASGITGAAVGALAAHGFFVCRRDLEDEFVRLLGAPSVQAIITQGGDDAAFAAFAAGPKGSGLSLEDQLRKFIHKVEYAAPLVAALQLPSAPQPLRDLLNHVQP